MEWAPLVGRPADYLPSGTVGQWPPAPCNGGTSKRAATLKPTKRPRGLTHNSRAGIPKRLRPNCQCTSPLRRRGRLGPRDGIPKRKRPNCHSSPKRGTLKSAWDASAHKGEGPQRPQFVKGKGPKDPGRCRLSRQLLVCGKNLQRGE